MSFFLPAKKNPPDGRFFSSAFSAVVTHFCLTTFDFAGFLVVSAVTQFFEGAFLVEFLFQTTQSALDRFAFLYADFGIHSFFHPLSEFFVVYSPNIALQNFYVKKNKKNFYFF